MNKKYLLSLMMALPAHAQPPKKVDFASASKQLREELGDHAKILGILSASKSPATKNFEVVKAWTLDSLKRFAEDIPAHSDWVAQWKKKIEESVAIKTLDGQLNSLMNSIPNEKPQNPKSEESFSEPGAADTLPKNMPSEKKDAKAPDSTQPTPHINEKKDSVKTVNYKMKSLFPIYQLMVNLYNSFVAQEDSSKTLRLGVVFEPNVYGGDKYLNSLKKELSHLLSSSGPLMPIRMKFGIPNHANLYGVKNIDYNLAMFTEDEDLRLIDQKPDSEITDQEKDSFANVIEKLTALGSKLRKELLPNTEDYEKVRSSNIVEDLLEKGNELMGTIFSNGRFHVPEVLNGLSVNQTLCALYVIREIVNAFSQDNQLKTLEKLTLQTLNDFGEEIFEELAGKPDAEKPKGPAPVLKKSENDQNNP